MNPMVLRRVSGYVVRMEGQPTKLYLCVVTMQVLSSYYTVPANQVLQLSIQSFSVMNFVDSS